MEEKSPSWALTMLSRPSPEPLVVPARAICFDVKYKMIDDLQAGIK